MKTTTIAALLLFFIPMLYAQNFDRFDIEFVINDKNLAYPLAGGLNCPQFSSVDLNDDGIEDLHIFDRVGNVHLTFLNTGTTYQFAPEYIPYFPNIKNWMLLRDYNNDGIMDIFAYSDTPGVDGVIVFIGKYENGHIAFTRFNFTQWFYNMISIPLSTGTRTQLYVSRIDYPSVDDVDCDGDLDILTFNVAGGYTEFYANRSVERGFGRDSLIYELTDGCWGGFYESGLKVEVDLAAAPNTCFRNIENPEVQSRHAGSTLLSFDADNDGDKELILGDLSFDNLNFLRNGGTCAKAWMNAQDNTYPSNSVALDLPTFPAAYYLDVNNDGKKDLLVAPNAEQLSEDRSVVWLYKNNGSNAQPIFQLQQKDFLVNEMLDLGTGIAPTFVDYNADGLLDLLVGTYGAYSEVVMRDARLYLFENVGTKNIPKFELVDDNYLNMSVFSQSTYNFAPTFGDLDGDGDLDLLVGEEQGRLFYAENIAGAGNPIAFGSWQYDYQGIDIGISSTPQIADLNRDGLPDLVIGERNGNINYFQNIGNQGNPQFNPDPTIAPNTDRLGKIDTRVPGYVSGYSAPVLLDFIDGYKLITGTEIGQIELYNNIENNVYEQLTAETEQLGGVNEGFQAHLAFADLDDDGFLEMFVGNLRGGLSAFKTNLPADQTTPVDEPFTTLNIQLSPNPASELLHIRVNDFPNAIKKLQLYNATGQIILQQNWSENELTLNIDHLSGGIYFVKMEVKEQIITKKIVIIR
ncbi:MAG: T9SS type A sorting domain-containing protein [Saprospiraceae bacterium]|nr:T9SS type A sorting domain-containing protein [Saprospiraceae bacterium]